MSTAQELRKLAAIIRAQEPLRKQAMAKKCAEILLAAKGLARLKEITQGESR